MTYKLLIADSSQADRQALAELLKAHWGTTLTILEAASGPQALELFHLSCPQIVILNPELAELSGMEVARKIRESHSLCVLLFLSDPDDFSCAREAFSLRALDYLLKPWNDDQVIATIREALSFCAQIPFPVPSVPCTNPTRLALVRQDIRTYIDTHYMEDISMKTVAHAMNYSDAYFCKLFKQCFQENFSAYLNRYRLQKAMVMITSSRSSIKEIAAACGYSDANYFTRLFKAATGLTPSAYRLSRAGHICINNID